MGTIAPVLMFITPVSIRKRPPAPTKALMYANPATGYIEIIRDRRFGRSQNASSPDHVISMFFFWFGLVFLTSAECDRRCHLDTAIRAKHLAKATSSTTAPQIEAAALARETSLQVILGLSDIGFEVRGPAWASSAQDVANPRYCRSSVA